MKKLLSRQQIIILNEKALLLSTKPPLFSDIINEKAVDWNRSILGRTSSGIGGLFSMLAGKIKQGFQKAKLQSLVVSWGTEYVIALEAAKKGVKIDTSSNGLDTESTVATATGVEGDETQSEDVQDDATFAENAKTFGPKIEAGLKAVNDIAAQYAKLKIYPKDDVYAKLKETISKDAENLTNPDNTQAPEDFIFDTTKLTQFKETLKILDEPLKIIADPKSTVGSFTKTLDEKIGNNGKLFVEAIIKQIQALHTLAGFYTTADQNHKLYSVISQEMDVLKKLKTDAKDDASKAAYSKAVSDAKVKLEKQFKTGQEIVTANKDTKNPAIKKIKAFVDTLSKQEEGKPQAQTKPEGEKKPEGKPETPIQTKPEGEKKPEGTPAQTKPENPAQTKPEESLNHIKGTLINEADAPPTPSKTNAPAYITNVFPVENLDEFKKIKGIKDIAMKNVNVNKLDIINYQADDIIKAAKNKANKSDKEDTSDVLEKEWELGLKYLNDMFKDVIDTNKLMQSVGKKPVGADIDKLIKEQDKKFKEMEDMSFDEKLPTKGGKFVNKGLYVFECDIKYMQQQSKIALENIFIALSPTADFIEDLDGRQYFWHKCFGQYKYNEETKAIERVNFLSGLTHRTKAVDKNANPDDYIYIAFTNQSVNTKFNPAFFYTKVGFFPLGKDIVKSVDSIKDALKDYDIKKWMVEGNELEIKILSRYTVDKEDITKYPGIDARGLANDKGFDAAKANHDILMPIVNVVETPKKK